MPILEIKKTKCNICGKEVEGKELPIAVAVAHGLQVYKHSKGIICRHCGTDYCHPDHQMELKFSPFSAYKNAKCQVCGEELGSAEYLFDPESDVVKRAQKTVEMNERTARSQGKVCPECDSANVKIKYHRSMSSGWRIGVIILGLIFLIGGIFISSSASDINPIVSLIALLLGSALLWEGLTLLPIPILNLKMIKINLSKEITCFDCGFKETTQISSE